MIRRNLTTLAIPLALALGACGPESRTGNDQTEPSGHHEEEAGEGAIALSPERIAAAGITLETPRRGDSAGSIDVPATIAADPDGLRVVAATVGGRIVTLTRNLGETVRRGDVLAIIESREAAELRGNVEAARARLALAESELRRETRLYAERVTPERDLIAARTAAAEARIALRQAEQALGATGSGGGALNRIAIRAPISGRVIGRAAILGQSIPADAELYRVARLGDVSVELALTPADAGRVQTGMAVRVTAPGRVGTARIAYLSPALDAETGLVPAIASLDNGGGEWRVGETVQASVQLRPAEGGGTLSVPITAVQKVAGQNVVFVRTDHGFRVQPVTLGDRGDGRIVVTSGLSGDERIAAENSFTLKAELGKGAAEHGH